MHKWQNPDSQSPSFILLRSILFHTGFWGFGEQYVTERAASSLCLIEGAIRKGWNPALGQGDITLSQRGQRLTSTSVSTCHHFTPTYSPSRLLDKEGLTVTFTSGEVCISDLRWALREQGPIQGQLVHLTIPITSERIRAKEGKDSH